MKVGSHPDAGKRSLRQSLEEYARGVAGGLLFSLPLIYTMEVWWAGFSAGPPRLLAYFVIGFLLLFGYNRYSGLHEDASWLEVAFEAVEEMGLGLLLAAFTLWFLGRLEAGQPAGEMIGKVVVEGVTAAIGVSVGSAQLGGNGSNGGSGGNGGKGGTGGGMTGSRSVSEAGQIVLAVCGAVLFASNVAPTEEIVVIAVESPRWKILALALLSLALGALILFYSDFRGAQSATPAERRSPGKIFARTVVNYAVALVASAFILWFFGRLDGTSAEISVAQVVVLGVTGSLGASVGRLLLQ
jgi:putative integral membrane protein (TIGR02587 family)